MYNVRVAPRIRGTCLKTKRSYRLGLTWYMLILRGDVCALQSRRCGRTIEHISFMASNIHELKCGHQRGDRPGILLRMGMITEVQLSVTVRVALDMLPKGSVEDLSITRWLALNTGHRGRNGRS